jgi:hypothetical protein
MRKNIITPAIVAVQAVTFLLAGMVALTSCTPAESEDGTATAALPPPTIETQQALPAALPLATIAHDSVLGDHPTEPFYTVVAHPDEWSELQGHLPTAAIEAGSQAGPAQDSLIVVAFAGAKDTSGHSLTVERVVRDQDRVIVTVWEQGPELGAIVEPATTLPYHLVAVPKEAMISAQSLTIEFRDKDGIVLGQKEILLP